MPDDSTLPIHGFHERQVHPRTHVLCDALLISGDTEFHCEVLNISAGGARVQVAEPIEVDGEVCLRLPRGQRLPARIIWQAGDELGLEFLEEQQDLEALIGEIADREINPKERRRLPRTSVLLAGQLTIGTEDHPCRVLNLSAGGAKVRLSESLSNGDRVILTLERIGSFQADVVWIKDQAAGLRFLEDPQIVAGAISRVLPTIKF